MDDKGRKEPQDMTEREIAEETLLRLRAVTDVLEALGEHPMARMMVPAGLLPQ